MNYYEKIIGTAASAGAAVGKDWCDILLRISGCIGVLLLPAAMLWVLFNVDSGVWQVEFFSPEITFWLVNTFQVLFFLSLFYFAWIFYLYCFKYRETAPVSDAELPTCAVIVPAYNEGRHVLSSLESVLASDYPADKLEIIAVNDGSKDDTIEWIRAAEARSGGRLKVIDLECNQGKRGAMYAGIKASRGEIFVTVDSDSVIGSDTLRRLVSPMAKDEKIGSVAGNVEVLNINGGTIPRILDVNFAFSFGLMRSAQSAVRAVFCAPGALTACRRDVVMPHLDGWLHQKFMGKPANIGEDRALTNIILRAGYGVTFQRSATVLTQVPEDYAGMSKMMIRWARSNVRENLDMLDFAFSFRKTGYRRVPMIINLLMQLWWMITPVLALYMLLYCMIATLGMFAFALVPSVVLAAALPAGYYLATRGLRNPVRTYFYAVWGFVLMFWISPYSLFSVHRSGWLTRTAKQINN